MTIAKKITDGTIAKAGTYGLCTGANLRTPCGPRRVEFMRKGDLIVTRDNGLQAVQLIWTKTVTEAEIAADPSLAPVVLKPRAIGPMMPQRELSVGRAHRLLIPGWRLEDEDDATPCLIPARDVAGINDNAFVARPSGDITYYNIVFETPQVFCANGLPIESFVPEKSTISEAPKEVRQELKALMPPKDEDPSFPRYKRREHVSYTPDLAPPKRFEAKAAIATPDSAGELPKTTSASKPDAAGEVWNP